MTTFNKIINVTAEELNAIDFGLYAEASVMRGAPQGWFFHGPGSEHYRLLAFISGLFENETLLDVGTYLGDSALALAHNRFNRVVSYDLKKWPEASFLDLQNVDFRVGDVLADADLLKSAPFIILDTYHNGDFEREFVARLDEIGYKGIVLFDDIHLNREMKDFWFELKKEKYDLTAVGHHSGTGIAVWK